MTRVLTTGQVARIFSVNINTVIKWFDEGKLDGFRLPRSNERRIYRDSVLSFMEAHDISPELLKAFDEERSAKRGRKPGPRVKEPTGAELRTFERKPVDLTARLEAQESGLSAEVSVRNLSMGGVFLTNFEADQKIIPTEFRLVMDTDRGPLDGICQLVHVRRLEDHSMSFGCRFTHVDPGTLQSYLATV